MDRKLLLQLSIGVSIIVLGTVLLLDLDDQVVGSTNQYWNHVENHYPQIAGKIGAPDGIYSAFTLEVHEDDSTVFFPLCPSYGGELHGHWKFNNHTVALEKNEWYLITLKNNVIVQASTTNLQALHTQSAHT